MSEKRKKITKAICESTKSYEEKLAARTILYVPENGNSIEVVYFYQSY